MVIGVSSLVPYATTHSFLGLGWLGWIGSEAQLSPGCAGNPMEIHPPPPPPPGTMLPLPILWASSVLWCLVGSLASYRCHEHRCCRKWRVLGSLRL